MRITEPVALQFARMVNDEGLSQREAAKRMGISKSRLRNATYRFGLEIVLPNSFSEKHKRTSVRVFNDARRNGKTVCEAEQVCGHSANAILAWAKEYGIGRTETQGKASSWVLVQTLFFFGSGRNVYGDKI